MHQDAYKTYLFNDKIKFLSKEITFLHTNFFFKSIKHEVFKEKYYNYFIYQDYNKKKTIFSQDENLDHIYFIKEGEIEVSMNCNLISINELIIKFGKTLGKSVSEYKNLVDDYKENIEGLTKKHLLRVKFKLMIDKNCRCESLSRRRRIYLSITKQNLYCKGLF